MAPTHYQTLGVPPTAPPADIKRAYRRLVVQFHPDKHGGDARFEEQFKTVSVAYRVLSDAGRRATYDFQLAQARRRAEDDRRRQQFRPASQHVYGVPMPAPVPLRTRRPAGTRERHYQSIPKQRVRFTRQDYMLLGGIIGLIALFGLVITLSLNRWASQVNSEKAQQAFGRGEWSAAVSLANQSLSFRAGFAPALRLRGEVAELVHQRPAQALPDYELALRTEQNPGVRARLHYRSGRCLARLRQPRAAERRFSQALKLNPQLARAYLARAETRLLDLGQVPAALADLDRGLALLGGQPVLWRYVQLRGAALAHLGRLAEARRDYDAVLAAWPRSGRTCFLLGRLAQQEGNPAAACAFFRRALALNYAYAAATGAAECQERATSEWARQKR